LPDEPKFSATLRPVSASKRVAISVIANFRSLAAATIGGFVCAIAALNAARANHQSDQVRRALHDPTAPRKSIEMPVYPIFLYA
jgi:hypothetical protein